MSSTRGVSCPTCGAHIVLAVAGDPDGPYTPPSGHEIHRAADGAFVFDHCPDRREDTPSDQRN